MAQAAQVNGNGGYPVQTADFTPHPKLPQEHEKKPEDPVYPRSMRALRHSADKESHGRTVVVALDGTGDQFDDDNSNIVHLVSCLRKHDPSKQVTYYQSGIGTYDKGGLRNGVGAASDMAVGSGLGIHIKDAYRFLMQNYREGDKICLFGFSRGAYTVRCLAGMLHKVGLLPASNGAQVNFAYKFFKDDTKEGMEMSAEFKQTFCTNVNVYFVGVFDCVASVGFIPRKLPFSKSPTNSISYFRHAMALDEHRSKFKICQWQQQNPDMQRNNTIDKTPKAQFKRGAEKAGLASCFGLLSKDKAAPTSNGSGGNMSRRDTEQEKLEAYFEALDATRKKHSKVETDVCELWFMGCHADCGGGAVANSKRHKLSNIPLRWMLRQCFECDTGILFDTEALANQGLDLHNLWPEYRILEQPKTSPHQALLEAYERETLPPLNRRAALFRIGEHKRRGSEQDLSSQRHAHQDAVLPECVEDYFDARATLNDQLVQAKGWWILEVWPVKVRVLSKQQQGWEKKVRLNLGRYRAVRERQPRLHWTVQHAINEGRYQNRTRQEEGTTWSVRT